MGQARALEIHQLTMKRKLIVGLTGTNASGKGEVAGYLSGRGFKKFSLSDIVREEARKLGLDTSRESLIYTGNLLRRKHGAGVLARKIKPRLAAKSVVDSVRNTAEVRELRKNGNFILLGIDAPAKLRYERTRSRDRAGDSRSFSEFLKNERRENSRLATNQQVSACMKLADRIIVNDGRKKELYRRIETAIAGKKS